MTRITVLTDIHAGGYSSIVPPWSEFSQHEQNTKLGRVQRELWAEVKAIPEEFKHPDVFFFLGDAIDGKAYRNGSRELYTTDRLAQVGMAVDAVSDFHISNSDAYFVRGTPYHAGDTEDFEDLFAAEYGAKIENAMFVKVEGVTFHLQHKAGSSTYEHLRPSGIARERYYMLMQQEVNEYPKAQVILRGHVHYNIGAYGPGWEAAAVPAFTATGYNDYGTRQCKGVVHFGYTVIDVDGDKWNMRHFVTPLNTTKPKLFLHTGE